MRSLRPMVAVGLVAAAAAACSDQTTQARPEQQKLAPVLSASADRAIAGSYIIALQKGANPRAVAAVVKAAPQYVYTAALTGFAANLDQNQVEALRRNPSVRYLEQNARVQVTATQSNATWGLDRIDQRALPLSGSYTYNYDGTGVNAYIVDTGIRLDHAEFTGRIGNGYDAVTSGGNANDCNGHGTHVAGTVGGTTYGVAKKVTLHPVRVLDCNGSGTNAGVVAGMDWVTANRVKPAVANMSLGGGASTAIDDAANRMINAGVVLSVAAGNENEDACVGSPARVAAAITVGATDKTDTRASFSDYGSCLDLFAPGVNITSAWNTSSTATNTISGTSMATPHVTGVSALYMQANPSATPQQARDAIVGSATANVVVDPKGSPNLLLYSLVGGGGGTTDPCTNCTKYTGSLSGTGDYDVQPNGTYYYSGVSGYHKGWLQGPSTADFDLHLYKWNGSSWSVVAHGDSSTSTETISYSATAGYYYWKISSYSGSGSYSFWMQKP